MSNRAWLAAFNVSGNGYRISEPINSLECIVKAELRQIMSGPASYFTRETEVVSPTKSVKIPGPLAGPFGIKDLDLSSHHETAFGRGFT